VEAGTALAYDETEEYFFALAKAVASFARERFLQIACELRSTLMNMPATGNFELGQRNQWEEYSYYVENGPPELDYAFDALVEPLADSLVRKMDTAEAVVLTMARWWVTDELKAAMQLAVSGEELRSGIIGALRELASKSSY
jgi:hypothetical protein